MKVVLFCGGEGMRLRGYSEDVPKPMVTIGSRPVLWHVMKYYAHFGHKDFILCLGYKANVIKNYFLEYEESVSNDFVFSQGGRKLEFMQRDIDAAVVPADVESVETTKTSTSDKCPRAASAEAVTTVVSVGNGIARPSPTRKRAISA